MYNAQRRPRMARRLKRTVAALAAAAFVAASLVVSTLATGALQSQAATPTVDCTTTPNMFNTGYDGNGGKLSSPATDLQWQVAGPYGTSTGSGTTTWPTVAADTGWGIQPAPSNAGWGAANVGSRSSLWHQSTASNAEWISQEAPGASQAGPGASWYYKYDVNMDAQMAAGYQLKLDFYADNSVAEVYVNGVAQSNWNSTLPQGYQADPNTNPVEYNGYADGYQSSVTLSHGWQAGTNSIVVQTYSAPGVEGFLTQASSPATCGYSLAKTVDNPTPHMGDKLTYTVTVRNTGTVALPYGPAVPLFTDDLSDVVDDATFNNDEAGGGTFSYDTSTHILSWTGSVPSGGAAVLTYSATVDKTTGNRSVSNSVTSSNAYASGCSPTACRVTNSVVNTVTAVTDTPTVSAGSSVNTDVASNDTSATGAPLTVTSVTQPANGTATLQSDGTVTYVPNSGFSGADSYTYQVCDNSSPQVCDTGTVNVTVNAVFSNGPGATGGSTNQNTLKNFPLSSIVTTNGKPLDPSKVSQHTAPTNGSLSIDPSTGQVTYIPTNGYSGPDSFAVDVCDTSSPIQCTTRTISLNVGTNTVTANPDTQTVIAGKSVTTNVVDGDANGGVADTSASGTPLNKTTAISTPPAHGTATPNSDGTITYTPTPGYSGPDTYSYKVCDKSTPTPVCSIAQVTVTVRNGFITNGGPGTSGSPAGPNGTGQSTANTGQNTPKTFATSDLVQTTGKPIDPGSVAQVTAPSHGTLSINNSTGAVTYTPAAGYSGPDSFTVQVCDTGSPADCYNIQQSLTIGTNSVTANTDTPTVIAGQSVRSSVVTGDPSGDPRGGVADSSASGQPLNLAITIPSGGQPTHGTATANSDGTVTYTPNVGYTGPDSYQYRVCDTSTPTPVCATGTANVTVQNGFYTPDGPGTASAPDGPGGTGQASVDTDQNTPVTTPLSDLVQTTGKPINPASVLQTTAPSHGTLSIDPSTGDPTYTPNAGYSGPDSFAIQVCDSGTPQDCYTVQSAVNVGANVVAPGNDNARVSSTGPTDIDVLSNDVTGTGQPLDPQSLTVVSQPSHGTVSRNANGTLHYTPTPGYTGTDSLQYRVCDTSTPTPACGTGTVTLDVQAPTLAFTGQSTGIVLIVGLGAFLAGVFLLLVPRRRGGKRAHRSA